MKLMKIQKRSATMGVLARFFRSVLLVFSLAVVVDSFGLVCGTTKRAKNASLISRCQERGPGQPSQGYYVRQPLRAVGNEKNDDSRDTTSTSPIDPPQSFLLGGMGSLAAGLVLYSEYTLKTTGCGLPAGFGGLVGALEGVSYLAVIGIAGSSLYVKAKTGTGLQGGVLLGAAEGLSFLAIIVGLVVLFYQVADYGYIPNAVPGEGSICK
jgi:hypothetical protein